MRSKYLLLLLTALFLAVPLLAQDFAGFRIPKHSVYSVDGNVNGSYHSSNSVNSEIYTPYNYVRRNSSQLSGDLYVTGQYLFDSDPWRFSLSASGLSNGSRYKFASRGFTYTPGNLTYDNSTDKQLRELWHVSASARSYPWTVPVGFEGRIRADGDYSQEWQVDNDRNTYTPQYNPLLRESRSWSSRTDWNYRYTITSSVAVGYGRVRDASVVYDIYVVETKLKEAGALRRDLSPAAREKLQSLFYFRGDYSTVHDRSSKFFWQEVESILLADSALMDNRLDAYTLYRLGEGYLGQGYSNGTAYYYTESFGRSYGYFIGVAAEATHYSDLTRESRSSRSEETWQDSVSTHPETSSVTRRQVGADIYSVGLTGSYHRPFGTRWQFDAFSRALLPVENTPRAFILRNQVLLTYLLDDRWRADLRFFHDRAVVKYGTAVGPGVMSSWSTSASLGIRYYIEDHLSAVLDLSQTQSSGLRYGSDPQPPYGVSYDHPNYARSYNVSVGLSYHFLGALEAPGIVPPSTLLPPRSTRGY